MLRPGNAGSNAAADHIAVTRDALRQLAFTAKGGRVGRNVLVRTDAAGGTHEFAQWLHARKPGYSLGFTLPDDAVERLARIPAHAWTPAYNDERSPRDGAWVAEATGVLEMSGWPQDMCVVVRKERPHPDAQLRFTDADGLRLTAFATTHPQPTRGHRNDPEHRKEDPPPQPDTLSSQAVTRTRDPGWRSRCWQSSAFPLSERRSCQAATSASWIVHRAV
ncbi:hypothetical protein SAMN04488564_1011021 [Lentzea waywayandensis]|uniref:Transposase DDE domain-containing protein n=1 Tax=Lentzea waywayandensis TaxID=84724 RepID=A0A1I6D3T1_9PSEU|nr:hypothetical protein SAMN04488564_1011021 [Lentzea waywayandensis]